MACIISIGVNAQTDTLNNRMNSKNRTNSMEGYPDTTVNRSRDLNQDGYQQQIDTGNGNASNQLRNRDINRGYQDSVYKDAQPKNVSPDNSRQPEKKNQMEKSTYQSKPSNSMSPKDDVKTNKTKETNARPRSKTNKSTDKKMYLVPDSTVNKKN